MQREYFVKGYEWETHQRPPDSLGALKKQHNDLNQTGGGFDRGYSQEHNKIFHVKGIHFTITTNPFLSSLLHARKA